MRMNRLLLICSLLVILSGCASIVAKTPNQVIVLPDENIYTLPKNQTISLLHDGKPVSIAFPSDMKIVSTTVLVRQEQRLNDECLKSAKAKEDANKKIGLWGSIMAALAACLGIFFKMKSWLPKINASVSVK